MIYVDYTMPINGLGTDFSEYERPISFASTYTNRFRNINGGAERRPGLSRDFGVISGNPNLTRLHEFVDTLGTETLMSSDDFGNIWAYTSAWNQVLSGKSPVRLISAFADKKLIFCNGVDRNFYTDNAGVTFQELKAYITRGVTAGGTTTTNLVDGNISNWISQTLVSNNDFVYNVTRNGYGIVSTVASASLTTTTIGTGGNGAGKTTNGDQTSGDQYQLIDYVDLSVIPQANGSLDNIATATTGTTTTVIAVSGVDFSKTEMRTGDFVYNTTRSAVAMIGSVSANANLQQAITGQVVGDALAFFKSAMPIASWIHVHYGRVYYIDSRNQMRVVISAPDDPEDVTTFQQTLDATSFSFGTQQPTGDALLSLGTFQAYFVAAGKKNIYIYSGDNPIQDTASSTITFTPLATYPYGTVSRFCVAQNGGNLLYTTVNGLQAIGIGNISNTTIQSNASTPIRQSITGLIKQTAADNIQLSFYPSRAWLINKVGDVCYILNSNPVYDQAGNLTQNQAWHLFTGKWAQQNHYFVRHNGNLIACGPNGLVYSLDSSAATDDGEAISTELALAWFRLEEPQRTVRIKQGQYIKPVFESGPGIEYNIDVVAGWDNFSSDSIVVSSGQTGQIGVAIIGTTPIGAGAFAEAAKQPLRWRGEEFRITFTTQSSSAPDIITGLTVYGDISGAR